MENEEVWKPLVGYEGVYEISSYGNIRGIFFKNKERLIKQQINVIHGYSQLNLWINGIKKNEKVHRLVAKTFIENINNYPEINHIDGNKQNNSVENLE